MRPGRHARRSPRCSRARLAGPTNARVRLLFVAPATARGRAPSTRRRRCRRTASASGRMPSGVGIETRGRQAGLREQGVRRDAELRATTSFLSSRWTTITSGPMSSRLPTTRWLDCHPVMDHELEVQVRDPRARVARARGRLPHVTTTAPEPEVAPLDGVAAAWSRRWSSPVASMKAASPSSFAQLEPRTQRARRPTPIRSARMPSAWSSSTPARYPV